MDNKNKSKEATPEKTPVLINIVCGERRRQCAKDDFPFFKARGFEKIENDSKAPSFA